MRRQRTPMRVRLRPMSSYAYAYGAGGAALFDIVNVQIWTRRRLPARSTRSLPHRERRRDPFVNLQDALVAKRQTQPPQKRPPQGIEVQVLPGAPTLRYAHVSIDAAATETASPRRRGTPP